MSLKIFAGVFILSFITVFELLGQCNMPNPSPGLYCDPGIADGSPLLCNLDCLDGYTARMPMPDSLLLADQPQRLCSSGNQGDVNNLSWFAFVAGSAIIRFEIRPSNCTVEGNNLTGVQAGIYSKCYTWDEVYCIGDCQSSTFEIGGPGFTPGETYYFFLDGCNGSVCDYRVRVLEGSQPFPLPNIDSILVDFPTDTVCTNAPVQLSLEGLTQDSITYTYSVNPLTPEYPTGFHPEVNRSISEWVFSAPGTYTVCVEATNDCDVTPLYCQDIIVADLINEFFTDVDVCMEDLGAYRGPTLEDPNDDGVAGWQGGPFFTPGINRDTITLTNGCSYVQEINVNVINLSARESVEIYTCTSDFPLNYEGNIIQNGVIDSFLTLDNRASSGCDSLVSLTVNEVTLEGDIQIVGCENSLAQLGFVFIDFPVSSIASVSSIWRDPNSNIVAPIMGDEYVINATISGIYTIEFSITVDGIQCNISISSLPIDLNDIRPSPPAPLNWQENLCEEGEIHVYRVANISDTTASYTWVVPGDVTGSISGGDSLNVDWGTSMGGNICVTVSTACGVSDPTCVNISRRTLEPVGIEVQPNTCVGDTIEVFFNSLGSNTYFWDVVGGSIVPGSNINSQGPHRILFDGPSSSSTNQIEWIYSDGICTSAAAITEISVSDQLDTAIVVCISSENSVLFQWEDVSGAQSYDILDLSGNQGVINGNSYFIDGLVENEQVSISVQALGNVACEHSQVIEISCIAGCDPVDFELIASSDSICIQEPNGPINLTATGSDITLGMVEFLGEGVSVDGRFSPIGLMPGTYRPIAILTIGTCTYRDTVIIEVTDVPQFSIDIERSLCPEEDMATIILIPDPSSSPYVFMIDGEIVNIDRIEVMVGQHAIDVSYNECSIVSLITIEPNQAPSFSVLPAYRFVQDVSMEIPIILNGFDTMDISEIVWYDDSGNTLCSGDWIDCGTLRSIASDDMNVCADITYLDGCIVTLCTAVDIQKIVNIHAPNIFSPNGDGNNDEFIIYSNQRNVNVLKFRLYNRWGELIYARNNITLEDPGISWDGNLKGSPASPGVYAYIIEYEEEGVLYVDKGGITLVR